ncbi:MAG: sigma factor [Actinomycetota bacterium]
MTERTHVEPDRSAMAELYARYVPAGVRLAYLLTGNRQKAEDLAQEAWELST